MSLKSLENLKKFILPILHKFVVKMLFILQPIIMPLNRAINKSNCEYRQAEKKMETKQQQVNKRIKAIFIIYI